MLGIATFSNEFKSTEYGPTFGLLFWVALGSSSLNRNKKYMNPKKMLLEKKHYNRFFHI